MNDTRSHIESKLPGLRRNKLHAENRRINYRSLLNTPGNRQRIEDEDDLIALLAVEIMEIETYLRRRAA